MSGNSFAKTGRTSRKVILSRKGFDSSTGGCASPIFFEDGSDLAGTPLSLPIPDDDAQDTYADLEFDGMGYDRIVSALNPKSTATRCHVDPDIRREARATQPRNWEPAFGQTGGKQTQLRDAGVTKGDLFLFFGWFHGVTRSEDGALRYNEESDFRSSKNAEDWYRYADLQLVWGYMEVGDILTDPAEIAPYRWHPHAQPGKLNGTNNALYIPSRRLSFAPELPGCGTLGFAKRRVLTEEGMSRSNWTPLPFLMPEHVRGGRKNSFRPTGEQRPGDALMYQGQWQELIVYESKGLFDWAKALICEQ
ncbi:MAG: hypothetical protein MR415_00920 [Coriobacteriaceae bacterium]|nr:hypothetical protein [Coriobacteriaceae bacterium]